MYITAPVHAALAPRQTNNPLSDLISNAIGLGNSLLGDLMTSSNAASSSAFSTAPASTTPTSTTPNYTSPAVSSSSSLASSRASPTAFSLSSSTSIVSPTTFSIITTTTSPTLVSPTSISTPSIIPLSSSHHTNKALVIALPIILCLVIIGLAIAALWFYRRRNRRRHPSSALVGEKVKSSYASSDDDGLHHVPDWHTTAHTLPAPTLPMLDTAYARESPYEAMRPAPATTSPHNPFLLPAEYPQHDTSTTTAIAHQSTDISQESSDVSGPLVSPVSLLEMPTELHGDRSRWHAKSGGKHSRPTALWPSRTESSKFDFGFGGREDLGSSNKASKQQVFKVPRRPIGRS